MDRPRRRTSGATSVGRRRPVVGSARLRAPHEKERTPWQRSRSPPGSESAAPSGSAEPGGADSSADRPAPAPVPVPPAPAEPPTVSVPAADPPTAAAATVEGLASAAVRGVALGGDDPAPTPRRTRSRPAAGVTEDGGSDPNGHDGGRMPLSPVRERATRRSALRRPGGAGGRSRTAKSAGDGATGDSDSGDSDSDDVAAAPAPLGRPGACGRSGRRPQPRAARSALRRQAQVGRGGRARPLRPQAVYRRHHARPIPGQARRSPKATPVMVTVTAPASVDGEEAAVVGQAQRCR